MSATGGWIILRDSRVKYRDAGQGKVVVVEVHVPPLLLLQAALVHGVQQDPVEGVQQLRLRRAEVEY